MSKEYRAIARVVQSGTKMVPRSSLWKTIHEETGCGMVVGRNITLSDTDLDVLRRYGQSLTGLDPLFDLTTGSRIDLAEKTTDEKLAQDSVFGQLIVMATVGAATLPVGGREISIAPGTVLSVLPEQLDNSALTGRRILIVENGAIMPLCYKLILPYEWADAVIIYRGHRENARHVRALIGNQPGSNLGLFYDFDPEGLAMALAFAKGNILIPVLPDQDAPSKRETFRRQSVAMERLEAMAPDVPWAEIVATMKCRELAVMQEHMVANSLPLTAYSV